MELLRSKGGMYAAFILLGLAAGYSYWHFYGCVNGCTITGVWYNSTAYGGLMGYLVAGMAADYFFKKRKAEDETA